MNFVRRTGGTKAILNIYDREDMEEYGHECWRAHWDNRWASTTALPIYDEVVEGRRLREEEAAERAGNPWWPFDREDES